MATREHQTAQGPTEPVLRPGHRDLACVSQEPWACRDKLGTELNMCIDEKLN